MELQNSKDWAKVYRACNFIEKGVCEYADERVYVSQEALYKSLHTMKGRPVIIDHTTGITPENMHEHAVGYVVSADHNQLEAGCDCQFVIFDDKGKEVIADGYSVSCAYKPIAFGPGGTWHNVPYDREIVELEFTHLALVQNPRYEDAKVYENAKEEKGRWITVKGTHVFIKEGQSVEDAMKDAFKSSPNEKKEGGNLEGKYAKEDADFDVKRLKKDIDEAQSLGYEEIEDIAEFLGLDEDEVREALFSTEKKEIKFDHEGFKKFVEANKSKDLYQQALDKKKQDEVKKQKEDFDKLPPADNKGQEKAREVMKKIFEDKEKHNDKEDTMNVEEFFNKMGEMIEERLNACKSKMNEGDEEEKEDDDDKFEMDGEVYSKKELVNAWKEKKNAEESEEKSDEESEEESKEKSDEDEKQNSGDEFFNAMEKRMQQQANANDKIEIYSQAKGLEKGRSIYTK